MKANQPRSPSEVNAMTFVQVQVLGAKRLSKKLGRTALRATDLTRAWHRIGAAIEVDAIRLAPVLTGELVNSIRAGKSRSQATVRVGYPRMDNFVKTIHYGGWASGSYGPHYIEANPFMSVALHMNEDTAEREVSKEINSILGRTGLK